MANTYTQIHIHAVFAVQNRQSLIQEKWETDLYRYISGIVKNQGHKPLQINGMPDHIHILIGMRPIQSLSDLMKKIKGDSSKWINKFKINHGRFSWQEGYGAFSYAKSQVPMVIRYIQDQKVHHQEKTFQEEYLILLNEFDIDFDERYILNSVVW